MAPNREWTYDDDEVNPFLQWPGKEKGLPPRGTHNWSHAFSVTSSDGKIRRQVAYVSETTDGYVLYCGPVPLFERRKSDEYVCFDSRSGEVFPEPSYHTPTPSDVSKVVAFATKMHAASRSKSKIASVNYGGTTDIVHHTA